MTLLQFKQSTADPCIYIKITDTISVVAVYVDDLIVMTKTAKEMQQIKGSLALHFEMKDLGDLHYCLGVIYFVR